MNEKLEILQEQMSTLRFCYNEVHNDIEWNGMTGTYEKASAVFRAIEVLQSTIDSLGNHE